MPVAKVRAGKLGVIKSQVGRQILTRFQDGEIISIRKPSQIVDKVLEAIALNVKWRWRLAMFERFRGDLGHETDFPLYLHQLLRRLMFVQVITGPHLPRRGINLVGRLREGNVQDRAARKLD